MAAYSLLDRAEKLLKARRFSKVAALLEPLEMQQGHIELRAMTEQELFDYYYMLGVACLYNGVIGSADTYFRNARKIRRQHPSLLLAFAVLSLRRGDTEQAVSYYLEILDIQAANKTALQALEFIKNHGDPETISQWVRNKKITRFYPPLGLNWALIRKSLLGVCLLLLLGFGGRLALQTLGPRLSQWTDRGVSVPGKRADLSSLSLSAEEVQNAVETESASGMSRYMLTAKEITAAYAEALRFFQNYRDNAAQVEINRILNSNSSPAIRQKARLLMAYLVEPTFDSLKDNYSYPVAAANPALYLDCWVLWKGRVSNLTSTGGGLLCDFLVGYEDLKTIEGIVPLKFAQSVDIDPGRAIQVLAKVAVDNGKLTLTGKSLYQPVQ
jgi:hypothetical protein